MALAMYEEAMHVTIVLALYTLFIKGKTPFGSCAARMAPFMQI
jgi:hypothetical protein